MKKYIELTITGVTKALVAYVEDLKVFVSAVFKLTNICETNVLLDVY